MRKNTYKDIELLEKFTGILSKKFSNKIIKIIFFGSRVKNISLPDSDYDILLILKNKNTSLVNGIYDVVVEFLIKFGIDISLKIYTIDAYRRGERIPIPFISEVKKTGVELWRKK